MTITLRHADLVDSIAGALQYISYYHPADYIAHLSRAYALEQAPAAKDAIAQILTNSKMCAEGRRPICQDTGIVNVFLKIGMEVRFEGFPAGIEEAVNEGVRKGYLDLPTGPGLGIELDDNAMAAQIGHDWKNREAYDADDGSVMDW